MSKSKEKCVQVAAKDWRERSEPLLSVPEDEREHPPHLLPRLSVVLPCSTSSSVDRISVPPQTKQLSHGDESMTVVLSAFYAKLLIVLGLALPVTSTIQNELYTNITSDKESEDYFAIIRTKHEDPSGVYWRAHRPHPRHTKPIHNSTTTLAQCSPEEHTSHRKVFGADYGKVFTMYLYVVSMIFLAYTFYHLRMAKHLKDDNIRRTRYGSFYLHMGVAGFSVGSIIYSCLQFGEYFDLSGDCKLIIVALKPALRILFMVAQTVFIFSYTDLLDPMRGVVLDRFGLMHLIATNVCEWLNVVIQETRDDIVAVAYDRPALLRYTNMSGPSKLIMTDEIVNATLNNNMNSTSGSEIIHVNLTARIEAWSCNVSDMITPLIRSMNPYLRPCGVEYSLLCAIIIVVIWNDICTVPGSKSLKVFNSKYYEKQCCGRVKSNNHFSVDCGSAHKGLFMGVAVLAGTIVSLMLFNGLFQKAKHVEHALLQINIWETIVFILMILGSGACMQRMRSLTLRQVSTTMPLEHALLLVTQFGVYLYYLFQIIGAGFLIQRFPQERRATRIIAPLFAVIQSSCQTLLVLHAWSRRCAGGKERPGRQLVTFLLVSNFALWLLNRVKNSRAEFHPLQMEFYGVWAWTLITHVSVPLLVCYRFQATVCFYEIWKNSYKRNKDNVITEDDIELKNYHIS